MQIPSATTPLIRKILQAGLGGMLLAELLFCSLIGSEVSSRPPNIVIVLIDDLGSEDLGVYGNDFIETPEIDALATEGALWTNAYSASPVCSPTRVALLTGRSPAQVGFTGHITAIGRHRYPDTGRIIPPEDAMNLAMEELTLAEVLKPAGYTSISIGKWHVGGKGYFPGDHGFDYNIGGNKHGAPATHFYPYKNREKAVPLAGGKEGEYLTDRLTEEAIHFMEAHREGPFFLFLSHYAVHTPIEAPENLVAKYKAKRDRNPGIDPVYAAMVESVDTNLGRLLRALDRLELSENTVVIFTSDNGALMDVADNRPFRSGKGHLYEGGLRIPLMIRWPEQIKPGIVSNAPAISQDLYPTIMDIAGLAEEPVNPLDGRSLLPDTWHATDPANVELNWYYPHYSPHDNRPGAAIRFGSMKLIRFYDPSALRLFDLSADPGENNDLAIARPEEVRMLQQKLDQWLNKSNPILHTLNPFHISN